MVEIETETVRLRLDTIPLTDEEELAVTLERTLLLVLVDTACILDRRLVRWRNTTRDLMPVLRVLSPR
jgi:hypothetical protein